MPQALPLTTKISPDSTRKRSYRTLEAKFGNGYGQGIDFGINNVSDSWQITYEFLNQTDRDTLVNALDAIRGWDYFTWTAPGDSTQKKWKVNREGWSERTTGLYYTITFTLEQTY